MKDFTESKFWMNAMIYKTIFEKVGKTARFFLRNLRNDGKKSSKKNPEDFWNDVEKKSSKILKLLHRKFLISWNDPRIGKNL